MHIITILLSVILSFSSVVLAYEEDQLKECIIGVKRNPITLGTPQKSIEGFCDCSLKFIVDTSQKDDMAAIRICASENFG